MLGAKGEHMTNTVRILGIDPGLRRMGWGVIDVTGNRLCHVDNGIVISDARKSLAERLADLHTGLTDVLDLHRPQRVAVEQTFVNKDAVATLKLGQARAIALLVPAQAGLPIAEYAPNHIKKAVVGAGHADKGQIHAMVSLLLPGSAIQGSDAADALAIAICHAHDQTGSSRLDEAIAQADSRHLKRTAR